MSHEESPKFQGEGDKSTEGAPLSSASRWDTIPGSQRDKERAGSKQSRGWGPGGTLAPAPCRETGVGLGLLAPSGFWRSWEGAGAAELRNSRALRSWESSPGSGQPRVSPCPVGQGLPGMAPREIPEGSRVFPPFHAQFRDPPLLLPPSPGQGFPGMAPLPLASWRNPEPSHPSRLGPGILGALPELPPLPGSVY